MSYQQFVKSETNPNQTTGGGGCICDASQQIDCKGPYIVCYGNSMADLQSPHVVVSTSCVNKMKELLDEGEALVVGERADEPTYADEPPAI